jgi:murein DD-endopeptidase MepM/ murein hydrolase activator NlpD
MAEDRKNKWISIMIIPEDGAGVKKWRITTRMFNRLKILLGISGVILVVGMLALFSVGVMYFKMKQYQRSNARLMVATEKLNSIAARLEQFEEKERTLRDLLGSHIVLPKAPGETGGMATARAPEDRAAKTGNEIEQAIARNETLLRHKPDTWPVRAWQVSDRFRGGKSSGDGHFGIDIIAPKGSNVSAAADGKVVFAGTDESLGRVVDIDHENGWMTRYGHNELLLVKFGDVVRKGQPVAIYGGIDKSGTGTHLHFEMYFKGKAVNPLDHLPKLPAMKITQR